MPGIAQEKGSALPLVLFLVVVAAVLALVAWFLLGSTPVEDRHPDGSRDDVVVAAGEAGILEPGDGPGDSPEAVRERELLADPTPRAMALSRIQGRLVGVTGEPLGGVEVHCYSGLAQTFLATDPWDASVTGPLHSTRTGPDGAFVLEPREAAPSYLLHAEPAGYGPVVRPGVHVGQEVTLVAGPGRPLEGTVVSFDDRPVVGAQVLWGGTVEAVHLSRATTSRGDGRIRIEDLPGWGRDVQNARLQVSAPGHVTIQMDLTRRGAAKTPGVLRNDRDGIHVSVVLGTGVEVTGHVTDADDGRVVPDAQVVLSLNENWDSFRTRSGKYLRGSGSLTGILRTTTDADGCYVLRHVPGLGFHQVDERRRIARIGVVKDGHAIATDEVMPVDEGTVYALDFQLWPAGTIRGRVVDAAGNPVDDARVKAEGPNIDEGGRPRGLPERTPVHQADTDERGRYELNGIATTRDPPTEVWVYFQKSGKPVTRTVTLAAGQVVTLDDVVIDKDLKKTGAVAGVIARVLDPAGDPVWGARVAQVRPRPSYITTDEEGRAEVHLWGGRGNHAVWLVARAPGYAMTVSERVQPAADPKPEVTIVLEPEHQLRGQVVYEDERPAVGAAVHVGNGAIPVDPSSPELMRNVVEDVDKVPWILTLGEVTADARGEFVVGELPPGPYRVHASIQGGPRSETQEVPDSSHEVRLVLKDPEGGHFLEGSVVDASNDRPLNRFTVELRESAEVRMYRWDQLTARRTAPGRFRFEEVPEGTYVLHVAAPGYITREQDIVVGPEPAEEPLVVRLRQGVTVRGRVYLPPDVDPRRVVLLFFRTDRNERARAAPDAEGRYQVGGLSPGEYRTMTLHEDWDRAVASTENLYVPEDATELVYDVHTVAAGMPMLMLTQKGAGGHNDPERPDYPVIIRDTAGRVYLDEKLGVNMGFLLPLAPGPYEVLVTIAEGEVLTRTLQVEAGERPELHIELGRE